MVSTEENIFGDIICKKEKCVAWNTEHQVCDADLDFISRVKPKVTKTGLTIQFGRCCKLPEKFRMAIRGY